jgi:two-component system chemotaxis response regulator CheV
MAGVLDKVDQRTRLVGQNRLELLLFRLDGKQVYGINVFKVREVLQCPRLTLIPQRHQVVRGLAHIRGGTISIVDLSHATGHAPLSDLDNCFVIIAEYNMCVQGFLVRAVERIVNMNWENIHPPPRGSGNENYLTAVTEVDDRLIEIIDVEKILAEVAPSNLYDEIEPEIRFEKEEPLRVLIADDSSVARKQIKRVVDKLGIEPVLVNDGREAMDHLIKLANEGIDVNLHYIMLISDIEMPEMDGYTLTANLKANPRTSAVHVLLHTSLSGIFNQAMVEKVGADDFLAKFDPQELARRVSKQLEVLRRKRDSNKNSW